MTSFPAVVLEIQEPPSTDQEIRIAPSSYQSTNILLGPLFMPDTSKDAYAASCNPDRRAKHTRLETPTTKKPNSSPTQTPRNVLPILPKRPNIESPSAESAENPQPPIPARRGRKPGPLSRSARETQRKLNHSIIEKARRTKINDALATLRQLVPADYGYSKADQIEGENEGEGVGGKKEKKSKATGKKEEKEKEFKLEILIRTVSFMQDLLARVEALETGAEKCTKCGESDSSKRKRDSNDGEIQNTRVAKTPRMGGDDKHNIPPISREHLGQPTPPNEAPTSRPYLGSRLPSISSWLPDTQIDPVLLSPSSRHSSREGFQLPSPPSSARFEPMKTIHTPPTLNLGPVASSAVLSPMRTPEDESAASSLLQISASSPPLPPVLTLGSKSGPSFDLSRMRTSCTTPSSILNNGSLQAQTPGTMLGLTRMRR